MDKQKQIEEIAKDLKQIKFNMQGCFIPQYVGVHEDITARDLYDLGYRKIPENAVVLTKEEYEELKKGIKTYNYTAMFDAQNAYRWEQGYLQGRKETAEKFAETLLDMVVQFCQMGEEGYLKHIFMSAEEQAFDVLDIDYGEKVDDVYERFNKKWNRPYDEICEEITEVGIK